MKKTIAFCNFPFGHSGWATPFDLTLPVARGLFESLRRAFAACGVELEYSYGQSPDIVLCSVFPVTNPKATTTRPHQARPIRLLWCVENIARWSRNSRLPIERKAFAASMTSEPDDGPTHMRLPNWLFRCADFHLQAACPAYREVALNQPIAFARSPTSITLIARSNEPPHHRSRLLGEFAKLGVRVDCPSNLGKNMPSIEEQRVTKQDFCRRYTFCICPENTFAPGYVTEKLMDALLAGCIPIYWGELSLDAAVFNLDRIIFIDTDVAKTAARVVALMQNPDQLRQFFEQPRFNDSACLAIDGFFDRQKAMVAALLKETSA